MSALVSVVVPVYNTETFLDRCVESILRQSYSSFELILVDDGSTDSCPCKCDGWVERDARVRVIHKENGGAGSARNAGIELACGRYVYFCDSDDYIDADTLELCVNAATEHGADMVCFGYDQRTLEDTVVDLSVPCPPKNVFEGDEVMEVLLPMSLSQDANSGRDWHLTLSACTRIFSMDLIRNSGWRFVSEREVVSEDFYSLTELHRYIKRAVVLNRIMYHYTVNPSSFSRSYTPERFQRLNSFAVAMRALSEEMGCPHLLAESIDTAYLGLVIGALKQVVGSDMGIRRCVRALREIVNDGELQSTVRRHRYRGENLQKKMLFTCIKHRMALACYCMVAIKTKIKKC